MTTRGGDEREDFLSRTNAHRIEITLTATNRLRLRSKPRGYVPADVKVDGLELRNVGIHLKGHGSFRKIDDTPSFSIKFNHFTPGMRAFGMRKLTLDRKPREASHLRAHACTYVFNLAAVPSPRVGFASVFLDQEFQGVYVLGESVTQDFLLDHFGDASGTLWEAEATDITGNLEVDYGDKVSSPVLRHVATVCAMTNLEERFQALWECVDVEEVAALAAAEVFCYSRDGYTYSISNYRVYGSSEATPVTIIPNLVDIAFNDPRAPILPHFGGLLVQALVETPSGQKLYLDKLAQIALAMRRNGFMARELEQWTGVVQHILGEHGPDECERQLHFAALLQSRISDRTKNVLSELSQLGAISDDLLYAPEPP